MLSLKKYMERRAEQAERKRLREEKKKEKELQKIKEKKERRKKKLKRKNNRKYYAKVKRKREREREKIGEEKGFFRILITKNRKRIKSIGGLYQSKLKVLKAFYEAIEKNKEEIKFPVKFLTTNQSQTFEVTYEILLIKSEKEDENGDLKVVQFRNAEGKFVDNVITDSNKHVILDKHQWNFEESFHVYGYHPTKDRKNFDFILNEIVLKNLNTRDDMRSIQTYANKVIIKYYDDFDFVLCKTAQEANRLVVEIERNIPKKLKRFVLFLGEIGQSQVSYWLDKLVEKTGWTRHACRRVRL